MNQDVYYSNSNDRGDTSTWSALDRKAKHPCSPADEGDIDQSAQQVNKTLQQSEEYIFIKDSCDVTVTTTDTKAAVQLQAALQAAIALVVSISIADSQEAEQITQELLQSAKIKQISLQKTVIENSRNVNVTTTDTQIGINIQLLLQILLALLVNLDIL
ncbi:spore coat protein [Halalkalibacter sp. APA_J-10(15)]|uniref:spore coat protein n=1 Tax=unclassified Halalkalibacter TaxID=2893063 RepID=UPI001FF12241|nr:spore coat protein [Halalkalibacter sp. APA_J-10(15)]MCK0471486.1 spore coat protein [Halalkalibacter sp. APA_J-10(15)]